jgi:3-carboxy-cis,cis-muconate cycloisomerase
MPRRQPFSLLEHLFADVEMARIFSEEQAVRGWLAAEVALARAQAEVGVITQREADSIAAAAVPENIDFETLWAEARNVGYPILSLVRMVAAALPEGQDARLHYGATTQDIMDTGLALQLREALDRLGVLVGELGDALALHVEAHRDTLVAARTHAQQAVPTTFGAKLAVFLAELTRHRERLSQVRPRVCAVSLHGAGGTSAAFGVEAPRIRASVAAQLDLTLSEVPWHVARDGLAETGALCAALAATSARFAREVINLSRTEIGEVSEEDGHHRGASSTMPQKANPIGSEAVVGMAGAAGALTSSLFRAMEAEHERAAGEWQIEWHVLPQLAALAAGALSSAATVARGLQVSPEAMRRNLERTRGLVMAEAYMMCLAPKLGRERAHDVVYDAAQEARREGTSLEEALDRRDAEEGLEGLREALPIPPERYVGQPDHVCAAALGAWRGDG